MKIVKASDMAAARNAALATYDANVASGDRWAMGRGESGNVVCYIKTVRGPRAGKLITRESYRVDGFKVARDFIATI
jgi:hypothetical protein